jgi:hypothetical protein
VGSKLFASKLSRQAGSCFRIVPKGLSKATEFLDEEKIVPSGGDTERLNTITILAILSFDVCLPRRKLSANAQGKIEASP